MAASRPLPFVDPCPFQTALHLAQHLESRWFWLWEDDEGWLRVSPAARLTDEDRTWIRQFRDELLYLVRTVPEPTDGALRFARFNPDAAFAQAEQAAERQGRLVRPPAGVVHA